MLRRRQDETRGRRRHGRHDRNWTTESSCGRAIDLVNAGTDERVPDVNAVKDHQLKISQGN